MLVNMATLQGALQQTLDISCRFQGGWKLSITLIILLSTAYYCMHLAISEMQKLCKSSFHLSLKSYCQIELERTHYGRQASASSY